MDNIANVHKEDMAAKIAAAFVLMVPSLRSVVHQVKLIVWKMRAVANAAKDAERMEKKSLQASSAPGWHRSESRRRRSDSFKDDKPEIAKAFPDVCVGRYGPRAWTRRVAGRQRHAERSACAVSTAATS